MIGGTTPHRRARPARVAWVLVLACLVATCGGEARAQSSQDVRAQLESTARTLERARRTAVAEEDSIALEQIAQAEQLQARARRAYEAGLYGDAWRLTRAASERVGALTAPRDEFGASPRIRQEMSLTDDILDRLGPLADGAPPPPARRLFDEATRLQAQAREEFEAGRYRRAGELTRRARQSALRASRASEPRPQRVHLRAERVVGQTRTLLDESEWLSEAGERAARAYQSALDAQAEAAEELESGRPAQAVRRSQEARGRLLDALEFADRKIARQAAAEAVRRSAERLEAVRRDAAGDRRARRILRAATDRQQSAERLLDLGRLPACLAEVRAVSAILDRAGL